MGKRTSMGGLLLLASAIVVAGSLLAVAGAPREAEAAFPGANGKIAFHSTKNGYANIYRMDPSGENRKMLTTEGNNTYPAFSPNGTNIAFESSRDGNWEIYRMNFNGSDQRNLTQNPADDTEPAWSADGARIAFVRNGNILAMNAYTGADVVRLTRNGTSPAWSPDGTKVAFERDGQVWTMNADGSSERRITSVGTNHDPNWSPDGSKIAFENFRDGNSDIWVMVADGGDQRRLTEASEHDIRPAFSPDGSRIVFNSNRRNGSFGIYKMPADGQGERRLTPDVRDLAEVAPDWQAVR